MLQEREADDYVITSGESHSVREFVGLTFKEDGLNGEDYVLAGKRFYRPADVNEFHGDASKAKRVLRGELQTSFEEVTRMMVIADVERYRDDLFHFLKFG